MKIITISTPRMVYHLSHGLLKTLKSCLAHSKLSGSVAGYSSRAGILSSREGLRSPWPRDLKRIPVCQGLEGVPVSKLDVSHMKHVFGEI